MEPTFDELANQNLAALGPVGITPGRFYFPTNPLNDPFIPVREVCEPKMPFVSLQELLQRPPNPSPQISLSDPSENSSESEDSFTFSTTLKPTESPHRFSENYIYNQDGQIVKKTGSMSAKTPDDLFQN